MNTKLIGFISATALALAAATPALAGQINWNFNTLLQNSGATPNASLNTYNTYFYQGNQTINAYSVIDQNPPNGAWSYPELDLWYKDGSTASEQGLGLANDPYSSGEIYNPYGIELDLSGPNAVFGTVTIGSVQTGETYQIWGYTGSKWISLDSGSGGGTVSFKVGNVGRFVNLIISDPYTATQTQTSSNDIVLMSVTTVPEPGTLALLAAGLAALGFAVSRRRKVKTDA